MGLPNLVLGGTVATLLYKSLGYSDSQIAFWTGIIVLPWSFKPLWGPFMELYKTKKFYIQFSQLACALLFVLSVFSLYTDYFFSLSVAIFFTIAFFGATQDMAGDGIYLSELSASQQARYVGWQGTFYNVAKLFSNGGMVFLAGVLIPVLGNKEAWAIVLSVYAAIMLVLGFYNSSVLPQQSVIATTSRREVIAKLKDVITSFFKKKNIWAGILFIVLYRFAEGQAIKIGLGLTEATVGLMTGIYGTAAFVLGSLAAGYFVSNKGLSRSTLLLLCGFFNIPFIAYAYLASTQTDSLWMIGAAISIEHFGYGFGFIGIILFIMQQIAPGPYQMAHYAFGSAITYFGYTMASMLSGAISDAWGYEKFFFWVLLSTIPAFLVSALVPLKKSDTKSEL